jgi:hypothetical protein
MGFADFFNWNRVKLRYCDGASFTGDSEHKVGILPFTIASLIIFLNLTHFPFI